MGNFSYLFLIMQLQWAIEIVTQKCSEHLFCSQIVSIYLVNRRLSARFVLFSQFPNIEFAPISDMISRFVLQNWQNGFLEPITRRKSLLTHFRINLDIPNVFLIIRCILVFSILKKTRFLAWITGDLAGAYLWGIAYRSLWECLSAENGLPQTMRIISFANCILFRVKLRKRERG